MMNTLEMKIREAYRNHDVITKPALHQHIVQDELNQLALTGEIITPERIEEINDLAVNKDNICIYHLQTMKQIGRPVSAGYELHTVDDMVTLANTAQDVIGENLDMRCSWSDGQIISLAPSRNAQMQYAIDKTIFKRLFIMGKYGGLSPLCGSAGLYVHECTNMMELASISSARMTIRHTRNLPNRVDELVMKFNRITNSWELSQEHINNMALKTVNLGHYVDDVWNVDREKLEHTTRADNRARAIAQRYRNEQPPHFNPTSMHPNHLTVDGFSAFNAVQGYIQHNGIENTRNMSRAFKTLDSPRVKRAEQLILEA